jgi:hypothetical protein
VTPTTKYAYERLWKLTTRADLQMYDPDLLIRDVLTVVAALARAERENAALLERLKAIEDQHGMGCTCIRCEVRAARDL